MKRIIIMFLMATLVLICAGAAGIRENADTWETGTGGNMSNASDLINKEWKLIEVYIGGIKTKFTRNGLPDQPNTLFTINFDGKTVYGIGAPNRYSAPYKTENNQNISIMMMRSTLMASIFEPENLTEHDFYAYVKNSYSWRIINSQLELITKTEDGREARLVFAL